MRRIRRCRRSECTELVVVTPRSRCGLVLVASRDELRMHTAQHHDALALVPRRSHTLNVSCREREATPQPVLVDTRPREQPRDRVHREEPITAMVQGCRVAYEDADAALSRLIIKATRFDSCC